MTVNEIKELLNVLEAEGINSNLRLCLPLDPKLVKKLQKDYLVVLQESAWGQELSLTDKLSHL